MPLLKFQYTQSILSVIFFAHAFSAFRMYLKALNAITSEYLENDKDKWLSRQMVAIYGSGGAPLIKDGFPTDWYTLIGQKMK